MSELQQFMDYISDKKENTKKTYNLQYRKLRAILNKDIGKSGERTIIQAAQTESNINSVQALLNIGIMVRKMNGMEFKEIDRVREKNRKDINKNIKTNNATIIEDLPSYQDLVKYVDKLYDDSNWVAYVINYLLLNYQTRNQDILFDIVRLKRDILRDGKNYIWLPSNGKKVLYSRSDYKTSGTYGRKDITITDPKFILAIKRIVGWAKSGLKCGEIIPNPEQVGYTVKKMTLNQIGEAKYVKIVVDHFRGDLQKLKEISKNRGTSLETLLESYDIKNI